MNNVFLLTGGNMGDRLQNLQTACSEINKQIGPVIKSSSIYETAAWGLTDQHPFLNQVLLVNTDLSPHDILKIILAIEKDMGRKRIVKMGPRIIDIDILFYNDEIINTSKLTIPHPEIANRKFVLIPLSEIAPDFLHPLIKKRIKTLSKLTKDELTIRLHVNT